MSIKTELKDSSGNTLYQKDVSLWGKNELFLFFFLKKIKYGH